MRASLLPAVYLPLFAALGCSGSVEIGGAGGGSTASSSAATGAGGGSTGSVDPATTSSTGTGIPQPKITCSGPNAGPPPSACTPKDPTCHAGSSACAAVELHDGASTFTLRMAQLSLSKPSALAHGIGKNTIQNWNAPPPPVCQTPSQLFSWLLHFDAIAGTMTTGGARAGVATGSGYTFINATLPTSSGSITFAPSSAAITVGDDCTLATSPIDFNAPIMVDEFVKQAWYLPLHHMTIQGKLSPDHNCLGEYNADGLDPAASCQPNVIEPAYKNGAAIDAFIPLEDADQANVDVLQVSLCVFLTDDPKTWGDGNGLQHCKRDGSGKILFPGDWCAETNAPATAECADALKVTGTLAGSGVKLD